MTKKDAIKYLQQLYPNGGHCWLDEQRIEAIGMAIKALQEEPAPKIFEDMLNAKTPAESIGISAEEHDKIIDLCLYGKESEMVDIDDLPKEEPVSMWHDVSEEPKPNMELICVGQYGNPLVLSSNSDSFKSLDISKWAYFNDLLNLSNVQRTTKNCKESVSEDLEKEMDNYLPTVFSKDMDGGEPRFTTWFKALQETARHFAQWQKEQFEKNRLAHCDAQTEEEAEIERDFVMGIIEKEHRQPTFDDAIKYGMRLQKEKIMVNTADAVIGLPYENKDGGYTHLIDVSRLLPVGNNKIAIIFKED